MFFVQEGCGLTGYATDLYSYVVENINLVNQTDICDIFSIFFTNAVIPDVSV